MHPAAYEIAYLCNAAGGRGSSAAVARAATEVPFMLRGQNVMAESDAPPTRFRIANWGDEKFRGGQVLVNEAATVEIRRRMKAMRVDRVRIDVAHKTAFKKAEDMLPEDILGYGDLEEVPGEGLYVCNVEWTERGRKIWKALPDVSPAFFARKSDSQMTQLDSVGLCPNGELDLPRLCAADSSQIKPTPPGTYLTQSVTPEIMNKTLIAMLQKAKAAVPEQGEMSDDEYTAKLTAACADYCGGGEGGGGDGENKEKAGADAGNAALLNRLAKLETADALRAKEADKAAKQEILRKCTAEGKVMPFTDEQIFGKAGTANETGIALSALEAAYSNLKKTVEVQGTGAARQGDKPADGTEKKTVLSADQQKVAGMMGVTAEEMDKYAPSAG